MVFKGKRTSGHHHQWYRRMLVFTKQKNHFAYQRNLLWVVSGKQAWRKWQVPSCQEAWRVYTYLIDLQQGDWDLPVDLKDLRNISPRCMSLSHSFLLTMPKPLTVWITINCGKFWKRWEYQTTWLASWETHIQVPTVRTGHGTIHWFQIGKGVLQGCILSPCLFNFYAEYIMRWSTSWN